MSEFIGTKLTMNLGPRSYDIILKRGALENLYQFARLDRRVAIVTDSGVPEAYARRVADQCQDARIITVPQGEASKSLKSWRLCCGRCWTSAWAGATWSLLWAAA